MSIIQTEVSVKRELSCMTFHAYDYKVDHVVLTKVNTFGKTCWATSHALKIKDITYENNIPEGRYRSTASTSAPMAGAGDRRGELEGLY